MPHPTIRRCGRALLLTAALAAGGTQAAAPVSSPHPAAPSTKASAPAARPPAAAAAPVDINSAPRSLLETLPGIGKAEAERIVAGRPYRTKADLVTSKVLPAGVFVQIKGRIVARPPASGAAPTATPTPKSRVQG